MKRFLEVTPFPGQYADYEERDDSSRPLDVNVCGHHAIVYWDDFADRHLKILDVKPAGR